MCSSRPRDMREVFPLVHAAMVRSENSVFPFIYSTNGKIIWFQDMRNPQNFPREVAAFHTPEALSEMLSRDEGSPWNWLINTPIDRTTLALSN